jgi:hypothetical protein
MTLKPAEESEISFKTHMMDGMGGPHLFEVTVRSNDAVEPVQKLYVKAFFGP